MKYNLKYITILLMLVVPELATSAAAAKQSVSNLSREVLFILHWDHKYEQARQQDVDYLFGSIDGEALKSLTKTQKEQVASSMRAAVLKQMLLDKDIFKSYLISQYNQFFTIDELKTLIQYYSTDTMQMVIKTQLEHKSLTIEQINARLLSAKESEKKIIRKFSDSYLSARYKRFQEKVDPKVQKMIMDRLKEVVTSSINALPQIITAVSANK